MRLRGLLFFMGLVSGDFKDLVFFGGYRCERGSLGLNNLLVAESMLL